MADETKAEHSPPVKKKKGKVFKVLILIIILLAAGVVAAYFLELPIPGFNKVRSFAGVERTEEPGPNTPAANTMTECLELPSGGDTSYAGMVLDDGLLWISYYSSHEEKTSIYLAKVRP